MNLFDPKYSEVSYACYRQVLPETNTAGTAVQKAKPGTGTAVQKAKPGTGTAVQKAKPGTDTAVQRLSLK